MLTKTTRRGKGLIPAGALLLLFLCPAPAMAEDAEALLQKGIMQFRMGMFEESSQTFEQAAKATMDPGLLGRIQLNLGISHGVLKNTAKARAAFRAALEHDPSLTLKTGKIKGSVMELFRLVRAGIKGDLKVTADRPGARVRVDGEDVGAAPYLGRVPVGKHTVEVTTADGKLGFRQEVLVRSSALHKVNGKLVMFFGRLRVTSAPPGARVLREGRLLGTTPYVNNKVPVGEHPLTVALDGFLAHHQTVRMERDKETAVVATLQSAPTTSPKRRLPVWTMVTAGAALAVAGLGIGMGVSATSAWDEYSTTTDRARHDELRDTVSTRATLANVSFATAGALAITAAVLYLFVESGNKEDRSASLGVGPGALSISYEF